MRTVPPIICQQLMLLPETSYVVVWQMGYQQNCP
jgi:hypothetical protein